MRVLPERPRIDVAPSLETEALIEEARQRQRRRRLMVGGVLMAVLVAVGTAIAVVNVGGGGTRRIVPLPRVAAPSHPSPSSLNTAQGGAFGLSRLVDVTGYGVINSELGWATTSDDVVYLTDDAGMRWRLVDPPFVPSSMSGGASRAAPSGVAGIGTTHLWIAADTGGTPTSIEATDDGGATWWVATLPGCSKGCSSVELSFVSSTVGYALGEGSGPFSTGVLSRTTDGGHRWQVVNRRAPSGPFTFADEEHGWVSAGGYDFLATTDGGRNWHVMTLPSVEGLQPVGFSAPQFFGARDGVVAVTLDNIGASATDIGANETPPAVYVTDDGGARWRGIAVHLPTQPQSQVSRETLIAVSPIDWVFQGNLTEETDNAGRSWSTVAALYQARSSTPSQLLSDATFLTLDDAWVLTDGTGSSSASNGHLERTTNGGATWSVISSCIAGCAPLPIEPTDTIVPEHVAAVAPAPNGGLYVADDARNEILERQPDGAFTVVAGTGAQGASNCSTAITSVATKTALDQPTALASAPGGVVYVLDGGGACLLALMPNGTIERVAGNGRSGKVAAPTPARSAPIGGLTSIAVAPDGDVYLAGDALLVLHDDTISRVAVHPSSSRFDCVGAPDEGILTNLYSVAVDSAGDVYLAESICRELLEITPDGAITKIGNSRGYEGGTDLLAANGDEVAEWGFSLSLIQGNSQLVQTFNADAAVWSKTPGVLGIETNGSPDSFLPGAMAVDDAGDIFVATNPIGAGAVGAIAELTAAGAVELLWKSSPA